MSEASGEFLQNYLSKAAEQGIAVALLLLIGSFGLDLAFKNEIFQRAGALVVGLALVHEIEILRLRNVADGHLKYVNHLSPPGMKLDRIRNFEQLQKLENYQDVLGSFSRMFVYAGDPSEKLAATERLLKEYFHWRSKAEIAIETAKRSSPKIIGLAIVGTLVWAFGDWATNLVYHCPWQINC